MRSSFYITNYFLLLFQFNISSFLTKASLISEDSSVWLQYWFMQHTAQIKIKFSLSGMMFPVRAFRTCCYLLLFLQGS